MFAQNSARTAQHDMKKLHCAPIGHEIRFAPQLDNNQIWCRVVAHKLSFMSPFNMRLLSFLSCDKLYQHYFFLSIFSEAWQHLSFLFLI